MRVKVIEPFSTAKGNIPTGTIINIPEKMFNSLQGKVEALPFDLSHWQEEIKKLSGEIGSKDPGGNCWQWLKDNRPELWKDHLSVDMEIDKAYQEQDAGQIGAAISRTRDSFNTMIDAWNSQKNYKQPTVMVA